MKIRKAIHDDWETPQYVLDYIKTEFGDFFDPCPLNADFDGLTIDWKEVNYINPPYSNPLKEKFILKALEESKKKGKICILLIPAATETRIFHDIIAPYGVVRFIRKRIKFKGYNSKGEYTEKGTGQSGSMLVIFGNSDEPYMSAEEIGDL